MILAMDVYYREEVQRATVAGVLFDRWEADSPVRECWLDVESTNPYEPGFFYKKELPCLLSLLRAEFPSEEGVAGSVGTLGLSVIVVDGYVDLGPDHPGLGRKLYEALGGRIPVVGVAKTSYQGAPAVEVLRGGSRKPLYVTAAGIPLEDAAAGIRSMAGENRQALLLKRADILSRQHP